MGLGPELLSNPNFTGSASGWDTGGGNWDYAFDQVTHLLGNSSDLAQDPPGLGSIRAGGKYRIVVTMVGGAGGGSVFATLKLGGVTVDSYSPNDSGTFSYDVTAADTSGVRFTGVDPDYDGGVSDVSVKELGFV